MASDDILHHYYYYYYYYYYFLQLATYTYYSIYSGVLNVFRRTYLGSTFQYSGKLSVYII
jgi:hypothetical protein